MTKPERMSNQEEAKIENNNTQMFRPHLKRVRNVILGTSRPKVFSQIVFYIGLITAFIFGIWSMISFFILKSPRYLKEHKGVDVKAIIELRGRELGFNNTKFYDYLEIFHLLGICLWFLVFLGCIFFWRQKKWSVFVIVGCLLIYCSCMIFLLGPTYFVEDTTLFDKITLALLFVIILIHHFVVKTETNTDLSLPPQDQEEKEN